MDMLPDPILCHILSFVPTKTSVACSVLSKRWKLLWTFVPFLDLDIDEDMPFYERCRGDYKKYIRKEKKRDSRFLKIIDKLYFIPREFRLKKLTLNIRTSELRHGEHYLRRWISACLFEELELYVDDQFLKFPTSSHYSNMAALKLSECILGSVESCLFPKLRALHLFWVDFKVEDGGSLENFLSACPVLEKLVCEELFGYCDLRICVPTLTSLVFEYEDDYDYIQHESYQLVLETPALEYISCKLNATENSLVTPSLCNLSRADITCLVLEDDMRYGSIFLDLLKNLSRVESLKLSCQKMACDIDSLWVISSFWSGFADKFDNYSCLDELPVFDNLIRLELSIPSCDCVLVPHLLQKFRNLQHISIYKVFGMKEATVCWEEPLLQVPVCLSSTLSSFGFQGFEDLEVEVELVEYVKKHGKVLKNMTLQYSSYCEGLGERVNGSHKFWF